MWHAIRVALASRGQERLKVLGTEMTGRITSSHVYDVAMSIINAASFGGQECRLIFCAGAERVGFTAGPLSSS